MIMDIPPNQQIKYNPEFIEKFVALWTQYIALLIPAVFIIYDMILGNAFRNKILNSKIWSELKHAHIENSSKCTTTLSAKYDF